MIPLNMFLDVFQDLKVGNDLSLDKALKVEYHEHLRRCLCVVQFATKVTPS